MLKRLFEKAFGKNNVGFENNAQNLEEKKENRNDITTVNYYHPEYYPATITVVNQRIVIPAEITEPNIAKKPIERQTNSYTFIIVHGNSKPAVYPERNNTNVVCKEKDTNSSTENKNSKLPTSVIFSTSNTSIEVHDPRIPIFPSLKN